MGEVLVLCSFQDLWKDNNTATCDKVIVPPIKSDLPLPGIGVCIKDPSKPWFITIQDIEYDDRVRFHFDVLSVMEIKSSEFLSEMVLTGPLFYSSIMDDVGNPDSEFEILPYVIPSKKVSRFCERRDIKPPRSWWELLLKD